MRKSLKLSKPTAAERQALVDRLKALGYGTTRLGQLIKTGMTRGEIAEALIAEQRQARKAT